MEASTQTPILRFPLKVLLPALSSAVCSRAGEVCSVWPGGFPSSLGHRCYAAEYWTRWSVWSQSPLSSLPPNLLAQFAVLRGGSCNFSGWRGGWAGPRGLLLGQRQSPGEGGSFSCMWIASESTPPHPSFLSSPSCLRLPARAGRLPARAGRWDSSPLQNTTNPWII